MPVVVPPDPSPDPVPGVDPPGVVDVPPEPPWPLLAQAFEGGATGVAVFNTEAETAGRAAGVSGAGTDVAVVAPEPVVEGSVLAGQVGGVWDLVRVRAAVDTAVRGGAMVPVAVAGTVGTGTDLAGRDGVAAG
ncbi:MAG: hypothetical protein ACRDY1_15575, partial [Acidimicrobiales bacterium]